MNVSIDVLDPATIPAGATPAEICRFELGRRVRRYQGHNLVPRAGRNLLRDLLGGAVSTALSTFKLGSSAQAVSVEDTALIAEVLSDDFTLVTYDTLTLTVQYYLSSGALNGTNIREAGITTDDDTLYARYALGAVPDVQPKTSAVAVVFTWELTWTVTGMNTLERGSLIELLGHVDGFITGAAYPSGAGLNKLVPGSSVWYVDATDLLGGTFALEAIVKVENAAHIPTIGLFNLDDGAPDVALVGSTVAGAGSVTGERIRSGAITFPAGGTPKQLAVKAKTNNAAGRVHVWGARIVRLT